ncbi:MAG TPA: hypothetical protein VFJ79_03510 [Acidimicrobiales bacterium]|nr:hypothetical protein [Acidimicrobiales bacterium]
MRRALAGAVMAGLVAAAAAGPAVATTAGPDGGPALTVPRSTLAAALQCTLPRAASSTRRPVLLVHGTGLTPAQSWAWNYGRVLPALGYPTCTVALPRSALGDIQVASEYVVYAVDVMHQRWNSPVDVIGHSQGGLEPRWALRWWPGLRTKIDHYIGLASPNHGIYAADACAGSGNCWAAVWQMRQGSRFLGALNSSPRRPGRPATRTSTR